MGIKLDDFTLVAINEKQNLLEDAYANQNAASVTNEDLEALRAETRQQITDLQTFAEENTALFGINVGNILVGSLLLEVLLVLLFLLCRDRLLDLKKNYIKLKQDFSEQEEMINALSRKVESLTKKVDSIGREPAVVNRGAMQNNFEITNLTTIPQCEKVTTPPPPVVNIMPEDKYKDFVKEFNALANQRGLAAREAADDFALKYKIQALNCTNFEARMNDPIPPPIFGSVATIQNAELWAYEFEPRVYAVVPRIKTYTENHHTARAMGEIFSSNFAPGGTYSKIRVQKPAIFKGMWDFYKQGELELS